MAPEADTGITSRTRKMPRCVSVASTVSAIVPGYSTSLGELMGVKAIARKLAVVALKIAQTRVAIALPADSRLDPVAAGWRRLPDGRFAVAPPARAALLALLARATSS